MEEPDSSSSEDNETRDLQHSATSKVESDESYSDSDSDEHKEPKSMFHILKAAHVPGKYKQSLDPEADKHSGITDVRCLEDQTEQAIIEEEANNQSCVSTNDVDIEIQENKQGDDGVQRFSLTADSDFAETGIFGKSMLVISSTMVDGDQSMKKDGIGLSKPPPPPVPPKPSLRTYDQVKPDKEDRVSLDTRPKPAPRKSKRSSEAYSDEQILLTDVLPTEKISPVSPVPSPRMKRKSDETELPTGTETQLAESEMIEYQDVFDEKHESKSDEQMTDLQESSTTLGKEKEISSDNTVDTVDIGSAKDTVLEDFSENIISKQKSIIVEDKEEHDFTEETMIIKETTDFQQSGILSSFEILGSQETTNMPSEENDSDSEEKSRFVNNLQETDSVKGDNGSEQTLSESEPEFGTPDSRSEDEGETDEFYDSKSFQDIKKEDTDNTEMGAVEKDTEELFNQDESQIEKVDYMKELKVFDESVVIIGKGTVKETGYESLSSTVSSGDLTAATFQTDMNNAEKEKEETKSIREKISMFEAIGEGKSTKGSESDFEKTRKSYASGTSFEILSGDDSNSLELRSDDFLTRTEETVGIEGTDTVQINKDSGVKLPSGSVSDTEKESMQSPDEFSDETNADIYSQSGKPMDVNNVTANEHSLHLVGKYEKLDKDLESTKRDDIQNSEEDSLQDEVPPPIVPKSEKVLESLKLFARGDSPDIPPRSLPLKTPDMEEPDEEVKCDVNVQSSYMESFVECGKNSLSDSEETSPSQGEQFPAQSASAEDIFQQHNFGYQFPQQQQVPQYPDMQYEHQQQQQPPPGWNQQFLYQDQSGNVQYMNPYAFYNPNMNPGMVYQNPNMQYYQQPYFSYQHYRTSYRETPEREPAYGSHTPMQTDDTIYAEDQRLTGEENRRSSEYFAFQRDSSPYYQNPESDPNYNHHRQRSTDAADYTEVRKPSEAHGRSVEHIEDRQSPRTVRQTNLTKSKSEEPIHDASSEKGTASPSVHRSRSMPTKTPQRKPAGRDEKEKVRRKLKEAVQEEHQEAIKKDDYYIYFEGISPDTKNENLANLIEIVTKGEADPDKIIFNYSRTCALVTVALTKKPDIDSVNQKVQARGIDSKRPNVYEVPPPTSVAVSCEEDISNTELLVLYFESRKVGDVELKQHPYESEDGSCYVVDFGDREVVKRVCTRKTPHEWEKKILRVSPYFECKAGAIWNSELHVLKIPDPVVVKFQPNYLLILKRKCCEELLVNVRQNHCNPEFTEKGLELGCMLTPKMTGFKHLAKDWEELSRKIVDKYISEKIIEWKLQSSEQVWTELIEFFKSENVSAREDVVATLNNHEFEIVLIGFKDPVKNIFRRLEEKQAEIEKKLNRRTETVRHNDLKLRLLDTIGVFQDLQHQLEDLEVYIGDGEVTIEGQPEDISAVQVKIFDMDSEISLTKWSHGFSSECVDFVKRKLLDKVNSILKNKGITAVWTIDRHDINVCAFERPEEDNDYEVVSEGHYSYPESRRVGKAAEEILRSAVVETQENVHDSIIEVLTSPEWISFLEHITETYENDAEVEFKDSLGKIIIYGMKREADIVQKRVKDFLEENAIRGETVKSGTINVRFIQMHRQNFVERLEKELEDRKVKIELQDDCINIRGNKKGIAEAKKKFKSFFDGIICEKHTIQKVAVKDVFRDETEQGTIACVEKETSCLIKLPGENATFVEQANIADESDDSDDGYLRPIGASGSSQDGFGSAAVAEPGFQGSKAPNFQGFKAPNGVKVTLVKGELGKQDGNVIVVTTSPNLNLNSGNACKSVLKAGGQQLQDQCKAKYPNEIKFGEIAVIDGGGSLECNKVYLTTLPNWNSDHSPKQVLEKIMKDSLELASKHKMYSIIFCAMGTGQLKYPTDIVAMLMYQAVIDFDQNHPQSTLKEVSFVLYQKDYPTIKAFEEEERLRLEGGGERPTFDLKAGNMMIELSVENIAQQKVDGILCSTSHNMDLSRNGACQALLRAGGQSLQDECKAKYNNNLEDGNVVEIGGGKLSCKFVFLTVLPGYNADAIGILKKVIQTLLQLAQAKGLQSLALPALGTGFLRYPKDEVCKCMFETVIEWTQKNPNSCIKTVRFIMHAKDHAVIQRFKSYILNARGRGRRESRQSTAKTKHSGTRPKSAAFVQQSKAFYNAHANGVQIGKIKLSVFKDDILTQKTEAVVSSVGGHFEFIGAVAHELKNKCPKIEAECQKKEKMQKLHTEGVVMTKSFGLHAKYVIHVRFAERLDDWQKRFRKCLELANKKSLKTVAFPVLGTGKGYTTFHPEAIAGCMFDALNDFVHAVKNPSVKDISLIVYKGQPTMFTPIMDKLHKKVQEAASAATSGSDGSWTKLLSKTVTKLRKRAIAAVIGKEEGVMSDQELAKLLKETSSMEVHIYSDSKTNIERCKKELEAKLEKLYTKRKIENYKEIIKTLTQEEMKELDIIALADINLDSQAGVITIEGPTKQVSDVTHELQMKLLKIERNRNDTKSAEELFKLVQWQYEEVTEIEFKLIPYEKKLNQKIEQAYKANKAQIEFDDDDGECFVIDFKQLIEYRKSDDQDKLRVLRKDILKAAVSALPEEWADMKDNENIKVVSIPSTDKTYQDISNRFLTEVKTGSYAHRLNFNPNNMQVNKIERIQNRALYHQYQAKRKQMTEQKPNLPANMPVERELWHGTKYDAVTSIQMHGFNRSYSGNANGEPWYGEGVYFAGNASYSARGWLSGAGAGSKGYMFLVKTLTGELYKGRKGLRYLPAVDAKDPTILYDCAVDNLQNPMEFVIFNDTQAYPAYIITFTT